MSKKNKLVIVCKTYRNDFNSFCRLYNSYQTYNQDDIPMYVSVPAEDFDIFSDFVEPETIILTDESYASDYFTTEEYWGLSSGYINQEICKLSFWENKHADNYLFVDSDAYFIRDFYFNDFMLDDDTPYSVLVMDKDLYTEHFYKAFGASRRQHIQKIFDTVEYKDSRLLTCHGMTVMNARVLKDFKLTFMQKRRFEYKDLIKISPFEYSWYNAWLQKSGVIKVQAVEPFFKTYHMRIEYVLSRFKLISETDLADQYVGAILNSNWKAKSPPAQYQPPGRFQQLCYKVLEKVG